MSAPKRKGKVWLIDRRHPFDAVARMDVKKSWITRKEKVTHIIHEVFFQYLKDFVPNEEEQEIILKSLAKQRAEKYDMQTNKNNPFYGEEEAFEQYCRVKYKKLYDHINRMLDRLYARAQEKR